jgi:hypothetical protein
MKDDNCYYRRFSHFPLRLGSPVLGRHLCLLPFLRPTASLPQLTCHTSPTGHTHFNPGTASDIRQLGEEFLIGRLQLLPRIGPP